MAKIAQLIEAGDYLVYKGDWVTNTAYNVNDIVTWANDGHLYEVIKAHTSSASIKPDNTEYYKAMTADKTTSIQIYQFNKNHPDNLTTLLTTISTNMRKGRVVTVFVSQLDGTNITMIPYPVDANTANCTLVGARRPTSTNALEICYLFISTVTGNVLCKYVIYNAETMEVKKSGDYNGDVSIRA